MVPPCGVNLIALLMRFHNTCCRRLASPFTFRAVISTSAVSRIPFASATGCKLSTVASTISHKSTSWTSSRILPEMIRLTSSRSSINLVCSRTLRSMTFMPSFSISESGRPIFSNWVQPKITFSGVRSSWLNVARNSSFIRLTRSASWRAVRSHSSSRWRSSPRSRSSVISVFVPNHRISSRAWSWNGIARDRCQRNCPS